MKRVAVLFLIATLPLLVSAQKSQAEQFLDKVQTTYNRYKSFKSDFEISIAFAEEDPVIQNGQVYQQDNKFRLEMQEQIIVSDGQSIWTYTKADNKVIITRMEQGAGMNSLSPSLILKEVLAQDNKFRMEDIRTDQGQKWQMIEVAPTDRDAEFFKYQVLIDPISKHIQSIESFSKDGSRFTLKVLRFRPNVSLKDRLFDFDKSQYPNVKVEDLRL